MLFVWPELLLVITNNASRRKSAGPKIKTLHFMSSLHKHTIFIAYPSYLMLSVLNGQNKLGLQLYNKQKNSLICLMLIGVWILEHMCPPTIYSLDLCLTRVLFCNVRGAQVVKDLHYNHQQTEQKNSCCCASIHGSLFLKYESYILGQVQTQSLLYILQKQVYHNVEVPPGILLRQLKDYNNKL